MPDLAKRSIVGICMGPPKVAGLEKPASSVMKMTMLGASSGKRLGVFRHWCFESFRVFPATLADDGSGKGKTSWANALAAPNKMNRQATMHNLHSFIVDSPLLI